MMRKKKTLKETLNSPLIRPGIFTYLPTYFDKTTMQQAMAYYIQHKHRTASDVFEDYLDSDGKVTEAGERQLAEVICTMYQYDWDKTYEAIKAEYDPLKNVFGERVVEEMFEGGHKTEHSYDVNDKEQYENWKETDKRDYGDGLVTSKHYDEVNQSNKFDSYDETTGGHSNTRTPDGWQSVDESGIAGNGEEGFAADTKNVHTETGTVSDVMTFQNEKTVHKSAGDGDVSKVGERDDSETLQGVITDEKTREGVIYNAKTGSEGDEFTYQNEKRTEKHNINMNNGVYITSQSLIEAEIELRKKHFFEMMFKDINNILTLNVYL